MQRARNGQISKVWPCWCGTWPPQHQYIQAYLAATQTRSHLCFIPSQCQRDSTLRFHCIAMRAVQCSNGSIWLLQDFYQCRANSVSNPGCTRSLKCVRANASHFFRKKSDAVGKVYLSKNCPAIACNELLRAWPALEQCARCTATCPRPSCPRPSSPPHMAKPMGPSTGRALESSTESMPLQPDARHDARCARALLALRKSARAV